jgi:hypothetical protein
VLVLDCMTTSVAVPYQTALQRGGGDEGECQLWVFEPDSFLGQAVSQKWSHAHEGLVNEQSPAPSLTGQACELEMSFSLGETLSFSSLPVSPRQCSA